MTQKKKAALLAQTRPKKNEPLSSLSVSTDPVKLRKVMETSSLSRKELIIMAQDEFPLFDKSMLTKGMSPDKYGVVLHPCILELMISGVEPEAPQRGVDTQRTRILNHLDKFGSITSLEAMQLYGIMRLASRISELRKSGYDIETVTEKGKNRYGEDTAYARYVMNEGGNDDV